MASPKHFRLIASIVALVLLGHWAALAWLQSLWRENPLLRPLAAPMYTRLLMPAAPPPVPVLQAPAAPARVKHSLTAAAPRPAGERPAKAPGPTPTPDAPGSNTGPTSPAPSVANSTATGTVTSTTAASSASAIAEAAASQASAAAAATTPGSAGSGSTAAAPAPAASATQTAAAPPARPSSAPTGPPAATDSWPADTRLSYRLSGYYRGELHGDARVQWQRSGERYQVRIDVAIGPLVALSMTSQGVVTPQGLVPHAYEELLRSRRRWATLGEEQVTLETGKQVARPAGVQDTASQFVELAHQFSSGRAVLQAGRQVQFWMARPGAVDLWTYDMLEEVTLHTPQLGAIRAIHLKPRPIANPRGNITAEIWFAPSLQYLPVRIRIQVGEGNYVDLLVDRIEQR